MSLFYSIVTSLVLFFSVLVSCEMLAAIRKRPHLKHEPWKTLRVS